MAVKRERRVRLSSNELERIERAASAAGVSVSVLMVGAALQRADEVIAASTTTVPAGDFDDLLKALDEPEPAQRLAMAARQCRRNSRIADRFAAGSGEPQRSRDAGAWPIERATMTS